MTSISSLDLSEIARCLADSEVPWGIFAGAAARVYGSPRPLKDLDILIPSDAGGWVAPLFPDAILGYRPDGSVKELQLPGCEILAGLTGGICMQMDAAMIAHLRVEELQGVKVSVISPEDNLVFKSILGRGLEVGKHDWDDVTSMLVWAAEIDWAYLYWRLNNCAPDDAPDLLVRLQKVWKSRTGKN